MHQASAANPRVARAAAARGATADASRGKATWRPVHQRARTRPEDLRQRLRSLHRLRAACEARGAGFTISARGADGKRLTCHFTDPLTVFELRAGLRRAIENVELRLARLERAAAQPQPSTTP